MGLDDARAGLGGRRIDDRSALVDRLLHRRGQRLDQALAGAELRAMGQGEDIESAARAQPQTDPLEAQGVGQFARQRAGRLRQGLGLEQQSLQAQQRAAGARSARRACPLQRPGQRGGGALQIAQQRLVGFRRPGLQRHGQRPERAFAAGQRQRQDAPGLGSRARAHRRGERERPPALERRAGGGQQRGANRLRAGPVRRRRQRLARAQQHHGRSDRAAALAVAAQPALRQLRLVRALAHRHPRAGLSPLLLPCVLPAAAPGTSRGRLYRLQGGNGPKPRTIEGDYAPKRPTRGYIESIT